MKKLILISILFASISAFAQSDTVKKYEPKHLPFISIGMNFSPHSANSISAEVGYWGTTSNTSFSLTFDVVPGINPSNKTFCSEWIGVKAYWTIHNEEKLCYMLYVAPKHCLNSFSGQSETELIEFGFNPYYKITKNILLGVTLGSQCYGGSNQWNIFYSAGFAFIL